MLSVLGLNSVYKVKYFFLAMPSGTPSGKGVYLTVYPLSRPHTDTVYLDWSHKYRHFQLQFQYCPPGESNIARVDSPYCSGSWGYIFQYTPSSTGTVLKNIAPALLGAYFTVHSQ